MAFTLNETCDGCRSVKPLRQVTLQGHEFLCRRCTTTRAVKLWLVNLAGVKHLVPRVG